MAYMSFKATVPSRCPLCEKYIEVGDFIELAPPRDPKDKKWVHLKCAQDEDRRIRLARD
jgi:hypothetical protein